VGQRRRHGSKPEVDANPPAHGPCLNICTLRGRAARPSQPRNARLAEPPAVLAGGGTLAGLRPGAEPVEGLCSSLKAVELANLTGPTLAEVIDQAHKGIDRVRRTPHLPYSFLRHTGLSVS
jgi:hypothetical protein